MIIKIVIHCDEHYSNLRYNFTFLHRNILTALSFIVRLSTIERTTAQGDISSKCSDLNAICCNTYLYAGV